MYTISNSHITFSAALNLKTYFPSLFPAPFSAFLANMWPGLVFKLEIAGDVQTAD